MSDPFDVYSSTSVSHMLYEARPTYKLPESADPCGLRVRVAEHNWGRFTSPPPPSALGPLAAKVGPDRLKNTLYVYWGLALVRMD